MTVPEVLNVPDVMELNKKDLNKRYLEMYRIYRGTDKSDLLTKIEAALYAGNLEEADGLLHALPTKE